MRLKEALFRQSEINIFRVDQENDFASKGFLDWILHPIQAKTLSAKDCPDNVLDGYFIIKAIWIKENGELQDCYLDLTMPERISEEVFLLRDNEIIRQPNYKTGEVVPAVAIEGFGVYELFYSRINPEIGIQVLREGLKNAGQKVPIAEDLAYILRDEDRHSEAIEAFTIVIENEDSQYGMPNEFTFSERARLYEILGDFEKASADLRKSEEIADEFRKSMNNRHHPANN